MKGVKPMKKKPKRRRSGRRKKRSPRFFTPEFKLKVVRLFLEEGYHRSLIAQEFNISESSVSRWSLQYRKYGEQGLQPKARTPRQSGTSQDLQKKIIDLKRSNPSHGSRRISDILKRFFLISASPATVHKTLADQDLVAKASKKPKKNPPKPRFFERATPNQMWQSDIMTFRLAGRNAYLIGYLDDYSRYITALGLYRSQTAENVIETYRRAISEYGVPKEMLTDNGRQYTNWRGTTRFEKELKKERVKHIKSRPHHPMTLGKIERFWQTILNEFLQRAQFTSFENAVERTAFWVKYYNYKRPHQGIGGLCPADRFFEIQHALKTTLEKGVEENALELALRGQPRDPFYMVGRMGDQSVVIRAEKGKVKMLVDGDDATNEKELVYDARKDIDHEKDQAEKIFRSTSENNGRVVGLDRTAHDDPNVPGAVDQLESVKPMAESGHGGDGHGFEPQAARVQNAQPAPEPADREKPAGPDGQAAKAPESHREGQSFLRVEQHHEISENQHPEARRVDHEGALRPDDRLAGGRRAGGESQDLLQVGAARPCRSARRRWRSAIGPAEEAAARVNAGKTPGGQPGRGRAARTQDQAKADRQRDRPGAGVEPDEKKMSRS
jgi:transposase InsO family protein